MTSASRAAPPKAAAATSAAHDPVPDDVRRADAALPNQNAQPHRGASTSANSTLVPCGKRRMVLERRAEAAETLRRPAAVRARRTAGCRCSAQSACTVSPADRQRHLTDVARAVPWRRGTSDASGAGPADRVSRFGPAWRRCRSHGHRGRRVVVAQQRARPAPRTPLPETSARLPSALNSASTRRRASRS